MKRNGPIPRPALRRNFRATVSLPNDVAELFGVEADISLGTTADGGFVPWIASQTDLLATDWVEVAHG